MSDISSQDEYANESDDVKLPRTWSPMFRSGHHRTAIVLLPVALAFL